MENITPDIITKLKAPLPEGAVSQHPTKKYLSTIKAIYVVERLNEVFGLGGWMINNEVIENECSSKHIVVKSTFSAPKYGIVIPDIFGGNDNADRGDAYKGACTDALTKIASYLYIGMDVYKGIHDDGHKPANEPQPKAEPKANGAELPWMNEKQFNEAKAFITSGQATPNFMELVSKKYRLRKEYKEKLNELVINAPEIVS